MNTKSLVHLAIVGALGAGFTAPAQADVLASAILNITNFKLVNDATGVALNNVQNVQIVTGNNFGTLSADLQSKPGIASQNQDVNIVSAAGGQFNGTPQLQGGPAPVADNVYTSLGLPPTQSFAYADNNLQGASINLELPGNANPLGFEVAAGVTAQTRADVSLVSTDKGTSTSTTGTNASLRFIATQNIVLRLSFDYFAQALAYVSTTPVSATTSVATAGVSWNFNLEDLVTGLTTTFKPDDLQLTASRSDFSALFNTTDDKVRSGTFTGTANLIAGRGYQLGITHQVQVNAQNTSVPEPGVLAVFGIGLMAMAAAAPAGARRRKDSVAM